MRRLLPFVLASLIALPAVAQAEPDPPLVVVVESEIEGVQAGALREAIGAALGRAAVPLAVPAAAEARALLSIAVTVDGAAWLLAVDVDGTQLRTRVTRPAPAGGAPVVEEDDTGWLVAAAAQIVRSLSGDRATRLALRAGLVPWDAEGMRQADSQAVSALTLLPWPERARRAVRHAQAAGLERGDGLSAPPSRGR